MTHWDGLVSSNSQGHPQRICVMGATNRIQDIDEAILRRMPKKFPVPLPNAQQRRGIFGLILRGTKVDPKHFDLDYLVRVSAGLSGSDIKETCRDAAMVPMREYIKAKAAAGSLNRGVNPDDVRGVRTDDFFGRKGEIPQTTTTTTNLASARSVASSGGKIEEPEEQAWTDESSDTASEKADELPKAAGTSRPSDKVYGGRRK
jgi:SpoVK/Ycf46/Vps4 family AAA+-type ATPase